ncbi:MAG: lactate racemase domain-containing protein [Vulcanimicrobiaceae bacterium]|jgi:hypothetical protein
MALIAREMRTPPALSDVGAAVESALAGVTIPSGDVAIGVGSRGIARLGEVVAALVRALRGAGARPFVVPAMGSHGAATAEGQADVLAHLGVTERTVDAPIIATMDTVQLGTAADGTAVFLDARAAAADAIVVVNRVKPHTSFRASIESGPTKMLAIGLGKRDGARAVHARGWAAIGRAIPAVAAVVLERANVAFALAIIENADDEPCRVEAVPAHALLEREPALLAEARANLPTLPLQTIDVLVVDRVGKSVSGTGADPNVTGRFPTSAASGGPDVTRLVYLAMADEHEGNGNGVGLADVVTERLAGAWDPVATYLNALTTTTAGNARMPMVMPDAETALAAALAMCPDVDPAQAVVVRIRDTLHVDRMWLSERALALVPEPYRVLRDPTPFEADTEYDR